MGRNDTGPPGSQIDPGWAQLAAMHARVLERLDRLAAATEAETVSRRAADSWGELAISETEFWYNPAQSAGVAATLQPQTSNTYLIEAIFYSQPAGASSVLTLGPYTLPLVFQSAVLAPLRLPIEAAAARSLVCSAAGSLSLILMGRQLSGTTRLH